MGGYWTRVEWLAVISRLAKLAKSHRFMTCGRLYLYDTLLEGLVQDLEHKDGANDLLQLAASVVAGPDIRDTSPGEAWLNMTHQQVIPL
jgi:hypothetical protein